MKGKKGFALLLALVLLGLSCACGGGRDDGVIRVVILKQMDHASLDEIASAAALRLEELAVEKGIAVQWEITSGQGDQTTLKQLGDQAIARGADVILPIATTAAQVAALCAEDTGTPVVYAAVSDPGAAGLTGLDHVTGTSDGLDTRFLLDMMLAQDPEIAKVGLLYSLSEPNSAGPVAQAREYLAGLGIQVVEQTANTGDEVIAAAAALIAAGVEAVFTPTDNVVMAAEPAIAQTLADAGIPHYTGADSFVRCGAFAACGVNYTALGRRTAELALEAALSGTAALEDCYAMEGGIITVNVETAARLGLDPARFAGMGTLVEVTTAAQ